MSLQLATIVNRKLMLSRKSFAFFMNGVTIVKAYAKLLCECNNTLNSVHMIKWNIQLVYKYIHDMWKFSCGTFPIYSIVIHEFSMWVRSLLVILWMQNVRIMIKMAVVPYRHIRAIVYNEDSNSKINQMCACLYHTRQLQIRTLQ